MKSKYDLMISDETYHEWLKRDLWTVAEAVKLIMRHEPEFYINGDHMQIEGYDLSESTDFEAWYEEEIRMRSEDYYEIENLMRLSLLAGALKNHAEGDMKAALSSVEQKRDEKLIVIESDWAHQAYVKPRDAIAWAKNKQIKLSPELSGDNNIEEPNEYISPFIQLMLKATKELSITAEKEPKHADLKKWFSNNWPDNFPVRTDSLLNKMASLTRSPEAAKGGNKKRK